MTDQSYTLFETAIGTCGIVWTARSVCGMQLPEKDAAATRARVQSRDPTAIEAATPPAIRRAIDGIVALLAGEKRDLGDIAARAVGQAMGENPTPIVMPCHRVLAAGGKTGGFSAPGGVVTKLQLLTIEGAQPGGPTLFDRLPLEARCRG
jgi:methylated-DNA-[protein]-cysteine S-methyltransferase